MPHVLARCSQRPIQSRPLTITPVCRRNFFGLGKFEVSFGQNPIVSLDRLVKRGFGELCTFGGAFTKMGHQSHRIPHGRKPHIFSPCDGRKNLGDLVRKARESPAIHRPTINRAAQPSTFPALRTVRWASSAAAHPHVMAYNQARSAPRRGGLGCARNVRRSRCDGLARGAPRGRPLHELWAHGCYV